jgi:cytidylate kinase
MAVRNMRAKYVPGTYVKKRPSATELAEQYILGWDEQRLEMARKERWPDTIPPTVCFSRKIGVGALEVADVLAEKTGYRVVDREILEYIASKAQLNEKTVAFFDERYPGKLNEILLLAFGEKSFIQSDYTKHLFSVVVTIAGFGPTIFVGRGTHLLLPRDRVLAVRFIASKNHRIQRLTNILNVGAEEVESKLDQVDRKQRVFFKKVYGKKDVDLSEFDIVINLDYVTQPQWGAEIVALTFRQKFGVEIERI